MQRVTAAVTIAVASCFLVANEHDARAHLSHGLRIDASLGVPGADRGDVLVVTVRLGPLAWNSPLIDEPGLIETWREAAEDALRKQLHMA